MDGRFVVAPIGTIRDFDGQGLRIGLNQIAILGPVRNGKLEVARLLTDGDGVIGGPYQAGISPDGDSALVVNALDSGGRDDLVGMAHLPLATAVARYSPNQVLCFVKSLLQIFGGPARKQLSVLFLFGSMNHRILGEHHYT